MTFFSGRSGPRAAVLLFTAAILPAHAQSFAPANLTTAQILIEMQHHDQRQADALKHYHAVRHYHAEYQGYGKNIAANMEVDANFDSSSGKSFRILSQSGSKLLCEKVLKRAVDSEREASHDKAATALTAANYRFRLLGWEAVNGRPAYIFNVAPHKESKFLYRGKIWVDAKDFAVAKIEAEPSQSPSFWISRTLIRYSSAKTADFWLPQQNHSETKVRIGGTAVLTIDYGTYEVESNPPNRAAGD